MKPREFFSTKASFTLFSISGIIIFWEPKLGTMVLLIAMLFVNISHIIQKEHILHRLGPNNLVSYKELYPETA